MNSISTRGLSVVSDRGAAPTSGTAVVKGGTSQGDTSAVELTIARQGADKATLKGGVSAHRDGVTDITMTRKGKVLDIKGTVGGVATGFKGPVVALTSVQESFNKSTVTGKLLSLQISLVIERDPKQPGVTRVTGSLYPYEQPIIGTVDITIRDVDGLRSYDGGTSKQPEGRVKLAQSREGGDILTTGKLGGWDVTALKQPAAFRDLEMFDTTLLVVMIQAIRRRSQREF